MLENFAKVTAIVIMIAGVLLGSYMMYEEIFVYKHSQDDLTGLFIIGGAIIAGFVLLLLSKKKKN